MDAVIAYFANDPLKVLYLLGGAGGAWFWVEKWLDRIRIQVRLIGHSFDLKAEDIEVIFKFEVVNIGKSPTSLSPCVFCTGYSIRRQRNTGTFAIKEDERQLPPHSTRAFTAVGRLDPTYPFWLFRKFRISPTRGASQVMHFRSNPRCLLSPFRYYLELLLFRGLGWLPFMSGNSRDD